MNRKGITAGAPSGLARIIGADDLKWDPFAAAEPVAPRRSAPR